MVLTSLIETTTKYANVGGMYSGFFKHWDKRALKKMKLIEPEMIINEHSHECYQANALDLLDTVQADIFYLDPPYNQRQYGLNYHIWETMAKYDMPLIKGKIGNREYPKSRFCNKITALEDLNTIVEHGKYKYFVLSYNEEGIMPHKDILDIFKNNQKQYEIIEYDYPRFTMKNNNPSKKNIKEKLYLVTN